MTVLFNDPLPVPNPAERAVRMALAIRECLRLKAEDWSKRGYDLSAGIGIAQGFATVGAIGFDARWDYSAIGTVTNLAARLCGEAAGKPDPHFQARSNGGRSIRGIRPRAGAALEGMPPAGYFLSCPGTQGGTDAKRVTY